MPGLYGYFDPDYQWGDAPASAMAAALRTATDQEIVQRRTSFGVVGCVRPSHVSASAAGPAADGGAGDRRVVVSGEILAVSGGDDRLPGPEAEALFSRETPFELLSRTTGSYAAAILDEHATALELVTDVFGSMPVYVVRQNGVLAFASQIKALLSTGLIKPDFDGKSLGQLVRLGFLIGDRTLLANVRALPPAAVLRVTRNGETLRRYRHLNFRSIDLLDRRAMIRETETRLRKAVARSVGGESRVGVPVSGGLDSRTLLALTPDPHRVPSFTFGRPGCRDLRFGAAVANAMGSPHHSFAADPRDSLTRFELGVWLTEGALGVNHFHILPHVPKFAEHCEVVLDGIGGDVLLGGKYVRKEWLHASDVHAAAGAVWNWLTNTSGDDLSIERVLRHVVARDEFHSDRAAFVQAFLDSSGTVPAEKAFSFLIENRTRRFIGAGLDLLRWQVEPRCPFFDVDLLQVIERIPLSWRRRQRFYVSMIQQAMPAAARVRWQHTGLPISVPYAFSWLSMATQRGIELACGKLGRRPPWSGREASDFPGWFRGSLREFVEETLLAPVTLDRGIFNPDAVRRVVEEHLRTSADHSQLLGILLSTELFCRLFIDDLTSSLSRWTRPVESMPLLAGG